MTSSLLDQVMGVLIFFSGVVHPKVLPYPFHAVTTTSISTIGRLLYVFPDCHMVEGRCTQS